MQVKSMEQAMTDYVILFADIEWVVRELYKLMSVEQYNSGTVIVKNLLKGSTDTYALNHAFNVITNVSFSGETSVAWGGLKQYGQELIERTRTRMIPDVRKRFVKSIVTVMLIMVAVRNEVAQRQVPAGP